MRRYTAENWQRRVLAYPLEHQKAIEEAVSLMRSYKWPFRRRMEPRHRGSPTPGARSWCRWWPVATAATWRRPSR